MTVPAAARSQRRTRARRLARCATCPGTATSVPTARSAIRSRRTTGAAREPSSARAACRSRSTLRPAFRSSAGTRSKPARAVIRRTAQSPSPPARAATSIRTPASSRSSASSATAPDRFRLARFDHDRAGWPLQGRHFVTPCATCHTAQRWVGLTTNCFDCHALDGARGKAKEAACHPFGPLDCRDCHTSRWTWTRGPRRPFECE